MFSLHVHLCTLVSESDSGLSLLPHAAPPPPPTGKPTTAAGTLKKPEDPVDHLLTSVPFDPLAFRALGLPDQSGQVIVGVQPHMVAVNCRLEFIR